jgi:hypothetical protein
MIYYAKVYHMVKNKNENDGGFKYAPSSPSSISSPHHRGGTPPPRPRSKNSTGFFATRCFSSDMTNPLCDIVARCSTHMSTNAVKIPACTCAWDRVIDKMDGTVMRGRL